VDQRASGAGSPRGISRAHPLPLILLVSLLPPQSAFAQREPGKLELRELEQRVSADSNNAAAHLELGRALLEKKRIDEAERHFRQAVAIAPGLAEGYLGLSAIPHARADKYWKKREKESGRESVAAAWQEAYKFYRLAFLLDPLVDPGLTPRMEERVTVRTDDGITYVWWMLPLSKAMNAFKAGKFADAMKRCEKLMKDAHSPNGDGLPYDVVWLHGLSAAHLDDFNVAATDFTVLTTRALRDAEFLAGAISPLVANDYRYLAALMHLYTGQRDLAVQLLQEVLTTDPSLYMAHSQLARIHERAGRLDEAVLERQRAVDANPENSDLVVDLGLTLLRDAKFEDATRAFEQAVRLNPRDPHASRQLGLARQRRESSGP
jgi:Tfp pilus assembly protein PilF